MNITSEPNNDSPILTDSNWQKHTKVVTHNTHILSHTISCPQCTSIITGAKTCPICRVTFCSACVVYPICHLCFLDKLKVYKIECNEMIRNRSVDQLVLFAINDLLTVDIGPAFVKGKLNNHSLEDLKEDNLL